MISSSEYQASRMSMLVLPAAAVAGTLLVAGVTPACFLRRQSRYPYTQILLQSLILLHTHQTFYIRSHTRLTSLRTRKGRVSHAHGKHEIKVAFANQRLSGPPPPPANSIFFLSRRKVRDAPPHPSRIALFRLPPPREDIRSRHNHHNGES